MPKHEAILAQKKQRQNLGQQHCVCFWAEKRSVNLCYFQCASISLVRLSILCLANRGKGSAHSLGLPSAPYTDESISPSILYNPPEHFAPEPNPTIEEIKTYAYTLIWSINQARGDAEEEAAKGRRHFMRRNYLVSLGSMIRPSKNKEAGHDEQSNIKGKGDAKTMAESFDDDNNNDDVLMDDV
jgi:hypothetical protein